MRLPRNVSGDELGKLLVSLGYQLTKQTGENTTLQYQNIKP